MRTGHPARLPVGRPLFPRSLCSERVKTEGLPGHTIPNSHTSAVKEGASHFIRLEIFQWELTQTTSLGDVKAQFLERKCNRMQRTLKCGAPCGTCEGLPPVLLSSCRGPVLHWSNPHSGQGRRDAGAGRAGLGGRGALLIPAAASG